jgi:phospholipid/cholesterol/gamma-HCH transport system substrate-binding protein
VSTELNTLFETVVSVSEKVDPVKLNATLTAAAQPSTGSATSSARRSSTATPSWPI